MTNLRDTIQYLIEAVGAAHESDSGHDYREYDSSRRHCHVCFNLKLSLKESNSLPGEDRIIVTRAKKPTKDEVEDLLMQQREPE